jgi:glycosyltransferase involved in cell wall biosynthesis
VRYGLAGKTVLLTMGRQSVSDRYKGTDRVIEALPELLREQPDLVFLIAGDGSDRPRLERLAREHGVTEAVRFVGWVPDRELPDLYRLADVFVMPSTAEGFGIVYLEAAASGVPVVASAAGGAPDALRDGLLGVLVDPEKPENLVRGIHEALHRHPPREEVDRFAFRNFRAHCARLLRLVESDRRAGLEASGMP